MQRRLGRRDYLLLTAVCLALILLAIQLPFGTRGFDRPQQGAHWKLLEAPGRALGWGGIALLVIAIPYALVAWLKGRTPGGAVSALGALVFGVGCGGLAGVFATTPIRGGGSAGGALAHMLSDTLGPAFASAVLFAIAIPGLFLSLAPLLLETGYVGKTEAGGGVATRPSGGKGLPPVVAKPWYPERRVGPDGEELPMQLGGADVGPIRYRDPPPDSETAGPPPGPAAPSSIATSAPEAPAPSTPSPAATPSARAPIPKAKPPPPLSTPTRKPPVITGVRYVDEEPEPAAPLTVAPREPLAGDELPEGVRFAPAAAPMPPPAPSPAPLPAPLPAPPPPARPLPPAVAVAPSLPPTLPPPPSEPRGDVIDATFVTPVEVPSTPPVPAAPVEPAAPAAPAAQVAPPAPIDAPPPAAPAAVAAQPPSVAGYRRKLSETGLIDGTNPAADRPGRPPKPRPRPATGKDWREALHGLFSSLPVEELPPARVPDELVGRSPAEEEAAAAADAPGQLQMFDADDATESGHGAGRRDALFDASVDAALERGSASLVLLKRKLGVGYARAASLMDALVAEGVLGEMTASGSRPTLVTQAEWNRRARR